MQTTKMVPRLARKILIVGHRANTWRIIEWYLRIRPDIIEVDARYMNDRFYAIHGPSPVRRASIPGKIMAWIDYHFFYRDPILKPIPLENILKRINGVVDVMIDIKQRGIASKLGEFLEKTGYTGKVYITSELHPELKIVKKYIPDAITIASINILPVNIVDLVIAANADMASLHLSLVDREIIDKLHSHGITVLVWTINDKTQAYKYIEMGVDGIVTDRPDLIKSVVNNLVDE